MQTLGLTGNVPVNVLKDSQLLIPGFIDTHIHAPQYPNAGLGYDKPLLEWLQSYTYPVEKRFSDAKYARNVYDAIVVGGFRRNKCFSEFRILDGFRKKHWTSVRLLPVISGRFITIQQWSSSRLLLVRGKELL